MSTSGVDVVVGAAVDVVVVVVVVITAGPTVDVDVVEGANVDVVVVEVVVVGQPWCFAYDRNFLSQPPAVISVVASSGSLLSAHLR